MFADIVQRFDTPLNELYQERDVRRAKGQKVIDLVSGNVNSAGFIFPWKILQQALAKGTREAERYQPDPLGQIAARRAIERFYHGEGLTLPSSQIVLTPGTSLSYWYLFKILANSGDEILCPTPNYALLDSIADLAGVKLTSYRLLEKARWDIDFDSLKMSITARTRAIVLISPHNPTGAVATREEVAEMGRIAADRGLPIISDEVFSPFLFNQKRLPRPSAPLLFTLNGVSKMFALPGLKIGWIGVTGGPAAVKKALHALDMISDTFLPVNEAAQAALPVIFSKGKAFLKNYQAEVQKRMEKAVTTLRKMPGVSLAKPEGGFYVTVKLPEGTDEEKAALDLLKKEGLLVHPGFMYDMEGSHAVLSFLSFKKAESGFAGFFGSLGRS